MATKSDKSKKELLTKIEKLKQELSQLKADSKQVMSEIGASSSAVDSGTVAALKAILESPMGVIIFSLDKQYRYLYFTSQHKQTMKQIWGVDIKTGDNMLDFIKNKEDRAKAKANFDRALSGERFILHEEYGDENLKRIFYEDRYSPVYDEDNNISGLSVFVIDITYQKKIAVKLQQQINRYVALNDRYKKLNEELVSLNQQLQATEQQLRASNQQLEANNQQLAATEQQLKAANIQLKASENNLKALFNAMNDIILEVDYNGKYLYVAPTNPSLLFKPVDEIIGKTMHELFPKEKADLFLAKVRKCINDNTPFTIQYPLEIKGETYWFEGRGTPKSENSILFIVQDISERKKANEAIIKLTHIATQSPVAIAVTDLNGNLEYVNPKFEELTGYIADKVIGKNPRILKSGKHSEKMYKDLWKTIVSNKTWRGEFHNKKKNGELYWERASISPIFDETGKKINYIKIAEDITASKRTEHAQQIIYNISNAVNTSENLQEFIGTVKEELGTIIDTTNFYVALYDSKTNTISLPFHVDQKDEITTFPAGKTLTAYVIKTKKSLYANQKVLDKLEEAGEVEMFGAQSKIWVGIPLILKKKAIGALVVQSYDNENAYSRSDMSILEIIASGISSSLERKRFEDELKIALDKAKESDRLKSAFLANMSHEIRTPLNGILGFANLLAEPDLTNDERSMYASVINKSSRRLMNTINDLIEISKIEVGQVDVINKSVSVNKLLNELYTFFLPDANEKGVSLNVSYSNSDEESVIITDEFLLNGILTNLIDNAIKFTNEGSISFGYEIKNDMVEFYVKDTGIGIPDSKKKSIFNRFEQAEIGHSRSYEGSGLGLSISKGYVEHLGGEIWLESEEGKGSLFFFTIPYNLDKNAKHQTVKNVEPESSEKILNTETNILVVDDEEINLLFLEKILKGKYDNIAFAQSGEQAVEIIESIPEIKVVLMDLKMPGIDGFEATKQIKKINKDVVVIAQTAYALEGDREKALEAGCDDYITKPIDKTKLLEMIEGYLGA